MALVNVFTEVSDENAHRDPSTKPWVLSDYSLWFTGTASFSRPLGSSPPVCLLQNPLTKVPPFFAPPLPVYLLLQLLPTNDLTRLQNNTSRPSFTAPNKEREWLPVPGVNLLLESLSSTCPPTNPAIRKHRRRLLSAETAYHGNAEVSR